MERTKIDSFHPADLILTGDWHLQEDTPVCRTDNFMQTQWAKVGFISDLQKKHGCPVIHSGDFYNHWKPSPNLLRETMKHLPDKFFTVYGNHDLPQHNLELSYKCGINVLEQAGFLKVLDDCHWNQIPDKPSVVIHVSPKKTVNILVWHVTAYQEKEVWMDSGAFSGQNILRRFPKYDLILTGDNHKPFEDERDGRILINPGSIFRLSASQIEHRPRVYLYYADTNTVEPIYLPIEKNVISRAHIEAKEERDSRIDAFISQLDSDWEAATSFEENLEIFKNTNKTRKEVIQIIYKAIES